MAIESFTNTQILKSSIVTRIGGTNMSTVITDGVTIQGDGSEGSPLSVIPGVFDAYGSASSALSAANSYTDEGLSLKQDTLVSGTNIKTINGESILGSGNIVIGGGGGSYTFGSGLTESGGNVSLGGTLAVDTTIDGDSHNLTFSNLATVTTFAAEINLYADDGSAISLLSGISLTTGESIYASAPGGYHFLSSGDGFLFQAEGDGIILDAQAYTIELKGDNIEFEVGSNLTASVGGSSTSTTQGATVFNTANGNPFVVNTSGDFSITAQANASLNVTEEISLSTVSGNIAIESGADITMSTLANIIINSSSVSLPSIPSATTTKVIYIDPTTKVLSFGDPTSTTVPDASDIVKGIVELATVAETTTGTDTVRAVTPAGVKAVGDTKWSLESGGTLTGANTITSNAANRLIFNGTWTASANTQYHSDFTGTFTARATASDTLTGYRFSPTLTTGAATQSLEAVKINPTFSGSDASTALRYILRLQNAGTDVVSVLTTGLKIGSFNTGTGVTATFISTGEVRSSGGFNLNTPTNSDNTRTGMFLQSTNVINFQTGNNVGAVLSLVGNAAAGGISYALTATLNPSSGLSSAISRHFGITGIFAPTGGAVSYTAASIKTDFQTQVSGTWSGSATLLEIDAVLTNVGGLNALVGFKHNVGQLVWGSVLSPSQITSNQDNYNPTNWYRGHVLRLSSDASRNITSVVGGTEGRMMVIHNVGSFNIVIKDDDGATGTAANRFAMSGDTTILPDESRIFVYDATSSRWRLIGKP